MNPNDIYVNDVRAVIDTAAVDKVCRLAGKAVQKSLYTSKVTITAAVGAVVLGGFYAIAKYGGIFREVTLSSLETEQSAEVATQLESFLDEEMVASDEEEAPVEGPILPRSRGKLTNLVLAGLRAKYGVLKHDEASRELIRRYILMNPELTRTLRDAHISAWLPRIYFLAAQPTVEELVYARMQSRSAGCIQRFYRYFVRSDNMLADQAEYRAAMDA